MRKSLTWFTTGTVYNMFMSVSVTKTTPIASAQEYTLLNLQVLQRRAPTSAPAATALSTATKRAKHTPPFQFHSKKRALRIISAAAHQVHLHFELLKRRELGKQKVIPNWNWLYYLNNLLRLNLHAKIWGVHKLKTNVTSKQFEIQAVSPVNEKCLAMRLINGKESEAWPTFLLHTSKTVSQRMLPSAVIQVRSATA